MEGKISVVFYFCPYNYLGRGGNNALCRVALTGDQRIRWPSDGRPRARAQRLVFQLLHSARLGSARLGSPPFHCFVVAQLPRPPEPPSPSPATAASLPGRAVDLIVEVEPPRIPIAGASTDAHGRSRRAPAPGSAPSPRARAALPVAGVSRDPRRQSRRVVLPAVPPPLRARAALPVAGAFAIPRPWSRRVPVPSGAPAPTTPA
ncbi:hypothetical protein PVAP13_6KG365324 [Panicum virgatum]|uniref:Uncharacterized protein n=1 Tax=Panicum virgatum TaxID=38727 RepID=A0A8T0RG57_PANVG|nr:hypothetical protein PVAP13_6KG365324 [Panicum virgatum]